MRSSAGGCWLVVGLLLGCGPTPDEVVDVSQGSASSGSASGDGVTGDPPGSGSSGPVADGSADSGSGPPPTSADSGTTEPVDPATTDPGTTSLEPSDSTGPGSTSDPGTSSGEPPPPPSCFELFGALSGYTACDEDDASCTFAVNTNGNSCTALCGVQGCLGAINNPGNLSCTHQGSKNCDDTDKSTTICICGK